MIRHYASGVRDARGPGAAEMLARLVAFDTTSRNSNLALIDFVADHLSGLGVESERLFDPTGAKANLFATLGPSGGDGGVVLSGHTDTVPVDGQRWATDPFRLAERGGRLYGRGSADMKGFVAAALALAPEVLARRLAAPVHLALSFDEEVGCLGAPRLVEHLRRAPFAPRAAIVGEPTEMRLADRHKSVHRLRTTVTGLEAHSAHTDRGVSAILAAGRLIAFLDDLALRFRAAADPEGGFDPPCHTVHVGSVEGGTADNIVPGRCVFSWEARMLPGADFAAEVLAPFEAYARTRSSPRCAGCRARPGWRPRSWCRSRASRRRRVRRRSPSSAPRPATTARPRRSRSAPRAACSSAAASLAWCSAPAASTRRTRPTNTSRRRNWRRAKRSSAACWTASRRRDRVSPWPESKESGLRTTAR